MLFQSKKLNQDLETPALGQGGKSRSKGSSSERSRPSAKETPAGPSQGGSSQKVEERRPSVVEQDLVLSSDEEHQDQQMRMWEEVRSKKFCSKKG